jgi:hypothetical protein
MSPIYMCVPYQVYIWFQICGLNCGFRCLQQSRLVIPWLVPGNASSREAWKDAKVRDKYLEEKFHVCEIV